MKLILPLLAVLLFAALYGCQAPQPAAMAPAANTGLAVPQGSTGNPPLIPHEVARDDGGETCLACHRNGDNDAPKTPHPQLVDCRQCHIPGTGEVQPFKTSY